MTYICINGYLIPRLCLPEQPERSLGKYGQLCLSWLKENDPITLDELTISGQLIPCLLEQEDELKRQIQQTTHLLAQRTALPDRCTNPVGWAGAMNTLHAQAEELALSQWYQAAANRLAFAPVLP